VDAQTFRRLIFTTWAETASSSLIQINFKDQNSVLLLAIILVIIIVYSKNITKYVVFLMGANKCPNKDTYFGYHHLYGDILFP